MANRRGTPAKWIPPVTKELMGERLLIDVCDEANVSINTIRGIYSNERPQLVAVVKFLTALGIPDEDAAMKVLMEMTGQNGTHPRNIYERADDGDALKKLGENPGLLSK